mmetsp:Transcript_150119/g.264952  ORF Transcript_150119/g.264952 Transcript_150119/m.264952 type:complete len:83 (+) Transcript_150119:178-426(+)
MSNSAPRWTLPFLPAVSAQHQITCMYPKGIHKITHSTTVACYSLLCFSMIMGVLHEVEWVVAACGVLLLQRTGVVFQEVHEP